MEIVIDKMHFKGHIDLWCRQHCNPNDFDDFDFDESIYVDDCLTGADTVDEALQLQQELQALFDEARLLLRKWKERKELTRNSHLRLPSFVSWHVVLFYMHTAGRPGPARAQSA